MNCPKCKSEKKVKDGIVRNKQRYQCKECQYRYTVEYKNVNHITKKNALHLYLEGLGFRSIGRYLKVSHVAVYNWIKSYGEDIEELRTDKEIEVVELDEMHTYIGSKKTISGYGLLLIDMEKDLSTSLLATEVPRLVEHYGKK